jgi:hypothetical protein
MKVPGNVTYGVFCPPVERAIKGFRVWYGQNYINTYSVRFWLNHTSYVFAKIKISETSRISICNQEK